MGTGNFGAYRRRKVNLIKRSDQDYEESEGEISEDSEYAEVKSLRKDLMGNEKDRKRLMAMTELERELELAERKKRVSMNNEARSIGRENDS